MSKNKSRGNRLQQRDPENGQFILGHTGVGGRPKGSRNRLGEAFIADLYEKWQKHGADVLDRVIRDESAAFLRTVAQTLPKELDATLNVSVGLFAEARDYNHAYRLALEYLNAETIETDDATTDDAATG